MQAGKNSKSFQSIRKKFEHQYSLTFPDYLTLLVWLVGIAAVLTLTVRDFIPLISEYRDNNMATQVQVILFDENFKPPKLVINFPREKYRKWDGNDLDKLAFYLYNGSTNCQSDNGSSSDQKEACKKLTEVGWDVWNDQTVMSASPDMSFYAFRSTLSLAFFKKMTQNLTENFLDDRFSSWNGPILPSVLDFFEWVSKRDFYLRHPEPDTEIHLDPSPDQISDIDEIIEKIGVIFDRLLNILCTRLRYTELDSVNEFQVVATSSSITCNILLQESDEPILLDKMGFWLPLPAPPKPITREYQFTIPNHYLISDDGRRQSAPITLYPNTGVLYASTIDGPYFSYAFKTPYEKRKTAQTITVKYKVQMRAKETRWNRQLCHNQSDILTCFVKCTKEYVINQCKCRLFSLRKGLDFGRDLPYCTSDAYTKCNITVLPDEDRTRCLDRCKAACEYTSYTSQIAYNSYDLDTPNATELTVKMIPAFDTFAEFSWVTKNTPEQFFSQLAGSGSFYLGVSGLSIFTLITACLKWWKEIRKKNRRETSGPERSFTVYHGGSDGFSELVKAIKAELLKDAEINAAIPSKNQNRVQESEYPL